ncbi:MAG: uroporphyrinogen-III synthase [Candidatus Berkiella sp.]
MNTKPLTDWHFVLLREAQQNQDLLSFIVDNGATATSLPSLTITPIPPLNLTTWIEQIRNADWIFVSSQNAVRFAPQALLQALRHSQAKVVTMGRATSESLLAKGVSIFFTPEAGANSESLLQEPFLQMSEVAGQKVVLLAGVGGRTLLYETLTHRQAIVDWVQVYRQEASSVLLEPLLTAWSLSKDKFCYVAMSQNGLMYFLEKVPSAYHAWLKKQAFIVVSERIAFAAKKWGIQHIFVAHGAHPEQLCAAMLHVSQFCHTMT